MPPCYKWCRPINPLTLEQQGCRCLSFCSLHVFCSVLLFLAFSSLIVVSHSRRSLPYASRTYSHNSRTIDKSRLQCPIRTNPDRCFCNPHLTAPSTTNTRLGTRPIQTNTRIPTISSLQATHLCDHTPQLWLAPHIHFSFRNLVGVFPPVHSLASLVYSSTLLPGFIPRTCFTTTQQSHRYTTRERRRFTEGHTECLAGLFNSGNVCCLTTACLQSTD